MAAKFGICLQELVESGYWIELLMDANIVPAEKLQELLEETEQLTAIFTASLKQLAKRRMQ